MPEKEREKEVKLPRWCPLCPTNGYHKPENCPEKKAMPCA